VLAVLNGEFSKSLIVISTSEAFFSEEIRETPPLGHPVPTQDVWSVRSGTMMMRSSVMGD
jgi:hypothetical protein